MFPGLHHSLIVAQVRHLWQVVSPLTQYYKLETKVAIPSLLLSNLKYRN